MLFSEMEHYVFPLMKDENTAHNDVRSKGGKCFHTCVMFTKKIFGLTESIWRLSAYGNNMACKNLVAVFLKLANIVTL